VAAPSTTGQSETRELNALSIRSKMSLNGNVIHS